MTLASQTGSQLNLDLNSGFESYQLCDLETDQISLVKTLVSLTYKGTTPDKVRMFFLANRECLYPIPGKLWLDEHCGVHLPIA